MNRFADDFVIALEDRHSGKRLLDVLGKRLDTGLRSMKPRRAMGTSVGDTLQRHRMASVTTFDFLRFRVSAIPTERQSERADRTTEQLGSPV